ncbi:hypothetical protein [Saccharothrix lopnurensis]|uniref:Hpr(Ser) kinase/phosphatase n=1 Tax=Saccharothrix lopnurensis TaxID=1670621 RepID=A0ABW1PBW3_9PSEU
MLEIVRECYGFRVVCSVHPEAREAVDLFFGVAEPPASAPEVRLTFEVTDGAGVPTVDPPHTLEVIASDPITIDTGNSRAVVEPDGWRATVTLARGDLDDQVVWGRFILERLFLYLVCRSPRHYPLHAGAVGVDGQVALVSAPTGTGKSTFSFWCLERGADLAGEDIMVRHLDDEPGVVWGYPRAVYLDRATIDRATVLDGALISEIDEGRKSRVRLPDALSDRLRPRARPEAAVFLVRDGSTGTRPLGVTEAVELCRGDFATGKTDQAVLAAVEADLRGLLAGLPVHEFSLSEDLDECFDGMRALLRAPQAVR